MRVLRLLAVPLLASIWCVPGVAQSGVVQSGPAQSGLAPQDRSPLATPLPLLSQPLAGSHRFSLILGTAPSGASLSAGKVGAAGFSQTIPPLRLRRYDPLASLPGSDILFQLAPLQPRRTITMAQNELCYTVREYTFTRDNPASDATTMKDYSACRPANNFHLKGAAPMR